MTTQIVMCAVMLNTGELVNMQSTLVDGTLGEIKTSGTVGAGGGIAATSIGTYANGKTITSFIQPPTSTGQIMYCYLARRGSIIRVIPIGISEHTNEPVLIKPIQLQAGDTLQALTGVTAAQIRAVNYNVVCNDGTEAVFTAEPTTASSGSVSLTHVLSGQSIGSSLTGRTIVSHFATGQEGGRYAGGSVLLVNDRGLPQGGCICNNPLRQPVRVNSVGTSPISLNWEAQVVLTS
jgi:hypothetical protein